MSNELELSKYIDGKSDKMPNDQVFKDLIKNPNPEMVSYIIQGMIDKKIPSTKILGLAAELTKDSYGLALVAIALRLGANPNVYLPAPGLGDVHILGWIAKNRNTYEPEIYLLLLLILISSGAKANTPMFNQSESLVKDVPVSAISVADWSYNNGYGNEMIELSKEGSIALINPSLKATLGALTDKPELIPSPTLPNIEVAILAHSKTVVSKYIYNLKDPDYNPVILYNYTLKYYATNIPPMLLKARVYPKYHQVNNLILKMKTINDLGYQTLLLQLTGMLKDMVIAGTDLDLNQLTILKTISPNIAKVITDAYASPYWKKACSEASAPSTRQPLEMTRLVRLAQALQYEGNTNSTSEICSYIKKVSEADTSTVLSSAITRQKARIAIINSTPSDFVSSKPEGICYNATVSGDELYEYSDIDLATYKDDEGHIYCFTKDLFPSLLSTKINPYSKKPLPQSFLETVARQQVMITNLGLNGPPETLGSGLKRLNAPDAIGNEIDNDYIQRFMALGRKFNINDSVLSSLTPPLTTTLLSNMGYMVDMNSLTPQHQYVTFVRTAMDEFHDHPEKIGPFFDYLRVLYSSSNQ